MSENVPITPGSGLTVAADEIASVKFQRIKLTLGADGVNDGDVSAANPVPVTGTVVIANVTGTVSLPTGAATLVEQQAQSTKLDSLLSELQQKTEPANTQTVAGTVAISSLPLPTGAAAEATLASRLSESDFDTRVGEVQASPTANTVLARLKTINDTLAAMGGGSGVQYQTDDPLGATPTGTLGMARRVDALGTLTPVVDNAIDLRVSSRGALWVKHDGDMTVSALPLPTGAATESTLSTRLSESDFDSRIGAVTASPTANTVLDRLKVINTTLSGTLAVSASSLPLPTGAASEATLAALNTKIPSSPSQEHTTAASPGAARLSDGAAFYKATTPSDTQPVSASSLPLPTGAAAETTLAALNTKIPASPATDRATAAAPFSTRLSDGSAFYKATTPSDTQPVSASSLPLPTGASTETTLAAVSGKLPTALTGSGNLKVSIEEGSITIPPGAATEATLASILTELGQKTEPSNTQVVDQLNAAEADYDTAGGTVNQVMFGLALPASGGPVAGGTATNPLRTDPTGATIQPVSAASLPLPTGAASETTLAALNTKIPASPSTDRTTAAAPFSTRLSDGSAFYKATTPSDTQPISAAALPLPTGAAQEHVSAASFHATRLTDGSAFYKGTTPSDTQPVSAASLPLPTGAATQATLASILIELGEKTEPANTQIVDQLNAAEADYDSGGGTVNQVMMGLALPGAGGPVAGGTAGAPIRTDPTGTTVQPVSVSSIPLPAGAATEATLSALNAKVPAAPSQEHTSAASPHSARLSDGAAFYKATTPADTQPISAASLPLPAGAAQEHVGAASFHATRLTDGTAFYKGTTPSDTQPVSASSLPLPTGASTEATLASILTELGQKTEPANTQIVDQLNAAEADYDSGGGTVNQVMFGLALPGAGGPVAGGTAAAPLRTDPTGATTQPVSASSLPLPAGAATEVTLAAMNTKIPASPATDRATAAAPFSTRLSDGSAFYKATTPSDTQPISAASLPLPTGAATETTLAAINTKIPASPSTDRTTAAGPFSTRLSDGSAFYKATTPADTQPVSLASLPLPAGAATETTLASILTELGQKTEPANTQIVDQLNAAEADYDTGGGTVNQVMFGLALPGSGGPVAGGTATNPFRTDPTGSTTQPVSLASLPLPTGAATEATLSAMNTKIPASPSTDRTTAAAPFSTRLSDGSAFYKATTPSDTQPVSAASLPLPTGAATETTLAAAAASLSVLDDWDETDRVKVNLIAGQAGITAGAGAVAVNTPRITHASDDPVTTALQVIDDWDETDRAKVNLIAGQVAITAGAGAVAANTPRVTHASDDPVTVALQIIDDWDESDRAKVNLIAGQVGVQGASGVVTALTQRVVLATDVALPTGANVIGAVTQSGTWSIAGTLSLPTGAATAANQTSEITSLQLLDDLPHAAGTAIGSIGKGTPLFAVADSDNSLPDATEDTISYVKMTNKRELVVSLRSGSSVALEAGSAGIGSVVVSTLPALAASTANIGDVDVLTLPALVAGSATIGKIDQGVDNAGGADSWNIQGAQAVGATIAQNPVLMGFLNYSTNALAVPGGLSILGIPVQGITFFDSATVSVPGLLPDGDAQANSPGGFVTQGSLVTQARLKGYNGTNWDGLRSTIANGLDVDCTRFPQVTTATGTAGSATNLTNMLGLDVSQYSNYSLQITGIAGGSVVRVAESLDAGTTYNDVLSINANSANTAGSVNITANGLYYGAIRGRSTLKVYVSTYGSGTVTGYLVLSNFPLPPAPVTSVSVSGNVAHDAADSGSPVKIGGKAESTAPAAVADADRVDAWFDTLGRFIVGGGSGAGGGDNRFLLIGGQDQLNTTQMAVVLNGEPVVSDYGLVVRNLPYGAVAGGDAVSNATVKQQVLAEAMAYDDTASTWKRQRTIWYQTTAGVTTVSSGTAVDMTSCPVSTFTCQVVVGGVIATYDVRIEGSAANVTWFELGQVTGTTSDATGFVTGKAARYMRYRVAGITGASPSLTINLLGCPR